MKRLAVLTPVFFTLFLFAFITTAAAGESFEIVGSGAPQKVLRAMTSAFAETHPDIAVTIPDSVGSGGGYKAVGQGKAVLGRVARGPKKKEEGYGLTHLPFARGPVVIMAHPSVTVKALTAAQAAQLFSGQVTNWKGVGGPDLKVRVVARQPGETSLVTLQKSLPGWDSLQVTEKSKLAGSDQEMSAAVAGNRGAVGFGPYGEAMANGLTVFAVDSIAPTDAAYPAGSTMAFIYKEGKLTAGMKAFIDFVFSPDGAAVITKNFAVPVPRP